MGRVLGLPCPLWAHHSPRAMIVFTYIKALSVLLFRGSMEVSLLRHDWLNHWPLGIELNLQPFSPTWVFFYSFQGYARFGVPKKMTEPVHGAGGSLLETAISSFLGTVFILFLLTMCWFLKLQPLLFFLWNSAKARLLHWQMFLKLQRKLKRK